jgi:hypothetical protein
MIVSQYDYNERKVEEEATAILSSIYNADIKDACCAVRLSQSKVY